MRTLMSLSAILAIAASVLQAAPPAASPVPPAAAATDAFAQKMEEVAALEKAGDFRKAMLLLRRMRVEFRDPKQVLVIDEAIDHVRSLSEAGVGAGDAVTQLGSSDRRVVEVAKKQLLASGSAGLIMLRKALQTGAAVAAANAAEALGEARDREAAPLLLERLAPEKGRTPLALAVMKALARMQKELTPAQLAECDRALVSGDDTSRCEMADVLMAAMQQRAGGNASEYDKLIGRPGAYESLRDAFSRAVVSGDPGLVAWACRDGEVFLPSVRGFRATYYSDPGFVNPVLERFEPTIEKKPEDPFPHPNGQRTTLSARWEADLTIGSPGGYAFAMSADDSGAIYIDGSNVVSTWGGQGRGSQPIGMTAGVYRIRVDYVQEQDAAHYRVWWAGPGFQDAVNLPVSTRPLPEQMIQLVRTVDHLTSTNWAASRAVKDRVISGGEAGMMVLRDAILKREEPVAIAAMDFLSLEGDARLFPVLVRRSADPNISPLMRQRIADAMRLVATSATAADCGVLLSGIAEGGCADRMVSIAGLCAVLDRRCGGSAEQFNALCGKADAHSALKAAVDATHDSKLAEDAAWLAAFGQPFVMKANGLSGRYWRGSRRDQPVLQRTDGQVEFWERVPPLTDAGAVELSATWDGALWVPTEGEYRFFLRGQNDARLWIDDEWVMGNGNRHHEPVAAKKLTKGIHRIKASLAFWWDAPAMTIAWEGPNMPKQVIPWWCLSSAPTMAAVTNAVAALASLPGLSNPGLGVPAQRAIRGLGGAAAPVLLQAIREGTDAAAIEALAVLMELPAEARDARAASNIVTRAGRAAAPSLREALAFAMREVASSMPEGQCKAMLEALKTGTGMDKAMAMAGLCAVLDRACGGKAEQFGARCGAPDAYDTLKGAVEAAMLSTNAAESAFAVSFGRPFSPLVPGLRARYWRGYNFELPGLTRKEDHIEVYDKVAGFSDAGNFEMSGRWEGFLNVPADAEYRFVLSAQNDGRVWIDGTQVVAHVGGHRSQDAAATAKLAAGPHRIKAEMRFGSDAPGMRLFWEGPGISRQFIAGDSLAVEPWPAIIAEGEAALQRMTNRADQASYIAARRVVMSLGPAGSAILRRAFRDAPELLAAEALDMLMEKPRNEMDAAFVALLLARAEKGPSPAMRTEIARALRAAAAVIAGQDLKRMLAAVRTGAGMDRGMAMAGLCAVLDRASDGKADSFNKRCGEPDAYETVKAAVEQGLSSKDINEIAWAAAFGQPFAPLMSGLRARYWLGSQFELPVIDRREERIEQMDRVLGLTNPAPVELSARWDGYVNVPADGDYKFSVAAQNEGKVWIDEKLVITQAGHRTQESGPTPVKLTAGSHRLKAEMRLFQIQDWSGMRIWVEGASIPKQLVGSPYVSMDATPEMVFAGAKALATLAALPVATPTNAASAGMLPGPANQEAALAAHRTIRLLGAAAAPVLVHAIRNGDESLATVAIGILLELPEEAKGATAAAALAARSEKVTSPALRAALVNALREVVSAIPEPDCKRMLATLKSGVGMDKGLALAGLCAVLDRSSGGKADLFNKRCGEPDAYETVKAAVEQGLLSKDINEIAWATSYGRPFVPPMSGLRARYWRGAQFDLPAIDRREDRIEQYERIPGITEQGPVELSARWEGGLSVPADGDYTFWIASQNDGRLWIDGNLVGAGTGNRGQEGSGTAKLAAGQHRLKAELRSWNDWPGMRVWWAGPNLPKQILAGAYLSCETDPLSVLAAAKSLARMRGLDNEAEYLACRRSVQSLGTAAGPMLRAALRQGPDSLSAPEAMRFLIEAQDPAAVKLLAELMGTNRTLRVNPLFLDGFVQLAPVADSNTLAWCLSEVRQAAAPDVDACLAMLCRVYLNSGGGDPGPLNRLTRDPKTLDTIKTAVAGALKSPDMKVLDRALRYGQPFAPFVAGATTRYYFGDMFDKLFKEQIEWSFGFTEYRGPQGWRGNNVSAVFDGFIRAPQAGDYVFRIHARGEGTLWLDNKPFFALAGTENVKGINMSAGFHPIRFALRQPGQDNYSFLHTDRTPMNGNRVGVDGSLVVSPPPATLIASLEQAAGDIDSKDPARVSAVRALMNCSGEPGLAFIRNLTVNAPERTAVSMTGLLVSQRPADTAQILTGMLRKNPKPESVPALVTALAAVAEQIQAEDAVWIHDGTFETTGLNERQQLRLLAAIADRACNGDKATFAAMMKGKSQAWDFLAQRFTVMTETPNTNDVFWALENGGPFVPKVGGVRGRFYEGQAFDRLYADLREECVDRDREPFHGRGAPLSAWWTGAFEVKQPGRYRIRLRADDFARLWIDGRVVVDGWTTGTGQDLWGETEISAGWHTLDVRYRHTDGDRHAYASIQGPSLNGRFDQSFVRCNPPVAFADWLYKELDKLGNDQTAGQAGQTAGQWRPMSDLFLRNMVRFGSPNHAQRAADILASWRDTGAKPIILNRAASTPDANLKKALEEAAKRIP